MKINKSFIYGAVAFMGMGLSSCGTEWLEVLPNTQETIEVYYTTNAAIMESVVAAYDPLRWFDYSNDYWGLQIVGEFMGDQVYPAGASATDQPWHHQMWNFQLNASSVKMSSYTAAYSGIKRCNDALGYMHSGNVTDMTEAQCDFYDAECRALRAYYYNFLWHWWGNVVYYDKNLSGDFLGTQYTADEVYEKVVTDLEELIEDNKLEWKYDKVNWGRFSMPAVYMLYTDMVLYQNDDSRFGKALGLMKQIINSPEYELMDDYAEIWLKEGEWCKESIFEIQYSDVEGSRNWQWGGTFGGTVVPAMILPGNYNKEDKIHDGGGWGFCTVRKSTYDSFEAGDIRRDASIWQPGPDSYEVRYQDTGLFLAKYAGIIGGNSLMTADLALNYNNNYRVWRLAETLLNAAELAVRGAGSKSEAQGWLDQVRSRAGLAPVDATLDNIINERAHEFLGEGKRYFDIVRSGLASQLLVPGDEIPGDRTGRWTENKKYLPFSQEEIDQSQGTLKQNPY